MSSRNVSRSRFRNVSTWDSPGQSEGASCTVDHDEGSTLKDSHRSGVVGSEKGTTFLIGFVEGDSKNRHIPKRLQQYSKKTTSEAEILNKQEMAAARKRRMDEHKSRQARRASEQAVRDMERIQAVENQKKWFAGALPKGT